MDGHTHLWAASPRWRHGARWRALIVLVAATIALMALPAAAALAASTAPTLVGAVSNNTSLSGALSVAVSGSDAYTTSYWPGELTAVDISNPAHPTVAGSTPPTTSLQNGSNITVAGNFAFVASKNRNASTSSNDDGSGNSMTVVDISNPSSPTVKGAVHDPAHLFGSYGVAVSGHYAFVAYQGLLGGQPSLPDTSTGGFSVIDLNNLGGGVVRNIDNGSLPAPWTGSGALHHATSVVVSGNYAYVTAFSGTAVTVIDISNPTSPVIVASLKDATNLPLPVDAAVSGNYLYVAQQTGSTHQLAILDISNPQAPKVVGTLGSTLLNNAYRIRVRGSFAYLAAKNSSSVVAVDVSDPTHPRLAGYLQDSGHLFSTSGLDVDTSGRYVIANSPELSTESGINGVYPPFTPTTGTISVIDMIPNPIAVTISAASEPANPTTQTSASFSFATTDDVSMVACALDSSTYGACTSATTATYSGLSTGSHTFNVRTTDAAGNTAMASYAWTITSPAAPANTTPPTISGTAALGQTLTVVNGSWTNSPTSYSHQWEDCNPSGTSCTTIPSATGQAYTLTAADAGQTIVVQEWAKNSIGKGGPANSTATAVVTAPPANSAAPTITGTAAVGQTLSASPGSWSGYPAPSYSYQWEDCNASGTSCSTIAGGQTYTVQASDAGFALAVLVTATNPTGHPSVRSTLTSVVSAPPPPLPTNVIPPAITGTAVVGSTLTRGLGSWTANPTSFPTQWERCNSTGGGCVAIQGATGQTYTPGTADVGHTIRVLLWAVNSSGKGGPATSTQTAVVPPKGPSAAAITAALKAVLAPRGKTSRIPALLRTGSYRFWFGAPGAGRLTLAWYFLPKGAHLTGATKGHPSPIKVATVTASFTKAGKVSLILRLTSAGKKLLRPAQKLTLTAKATFTSFGAPAIVAPVKRFTLWRH